MKTLAKLREEGGKLILTTPVWPTKPWYPVRLDMSIAPPVLFPQVPKHLTNPVGDLHPLVQNKTQFLAPRHVSNNQSQQEAYRTGLTNPFWHLGDQAQTQCTIQPGVNGICSWCKEREIDPLCPNLGNITEFLSDSFENGLQYRTINTYRSTLSNVLPQWRAFLLGSIF